MSIPDFVQINHSKKAKRLALRLDPAQRVMKLVLPKGISQKKASQFVYEHEQWIKEQLSSLPPLIPYHHGISIPVLGHKRMLQIEHEQRYKRTDISMDEAFIYIRTNKDDPSQRLERYFKNLAKEELSRLAKEKAALIKQNIHSFQFRDTKSRWGSCSSDNRLSFSWRLIFAPKEAYDYVVAHEVAHLIHMDHSKKFWALCSELAENYLEGRYWMQNHAYELLRYGAQNST